MWGEEGINFVEASKYQETRYNNQEIFNKQISIIKYLNYWILYFEICLVFVSCILVIN